MRGEYLVSDSVNSRKAAAEPPIVAAEPLGMVPEPPEAESRPSTGLPTEVSEAREKAQAEVPDTVLDSVPAPMPAPPPAPAQILAPTPTPSPSPPLAPPSAPTSAPSPTPAQREAFPIVGIGASAGGLEALDQFLSHVPADCGLAFVIVVHLDPLHKGTMPELLQRSTAMKVEQVRDQVKVRPNQVYLIPPNRDLSFLHGVLHLFELSPAHGLRLPIDFFFRSLAADQKDRSIGVILSGMGSDGTLGLRAIKEAAGLTP